MTRAGDLTAVLAGILFALIVGSYFVGVLWLGRCWRRRRLNQRPSQVRRGAF